MISLHDLVYVFGFTSILFLFPMPIPLFPIAGAIITQLDPVGGAMVGMQAGLFFGVPYMLIIIMMSYANRSS